MKLKIVITVFVAIITCITAILFVNFNHKKQASEQLDGVIEATEELIVIEPIEEVVEVEVTEPEEETPNIISLGEFKLTAYCSCEKCCGKWALNRPIDENGNEIIYGASGERLTAGVSIAVDSSIIPYGTEVIINGKTYIAHDTGGAIKGNHIDVYFDSHEEAWNFGLQYAEVSMIVNDIDNTAD